MVTAPSAVGVNVAVYTVDEVALNELKAPLVNETKVLEEITKRDKLDMTRSVCPLHPADDAAIIDTSILSIDDVVKKVESVVKNNA